jgi:hypothetical protein
MDNADEVEGALNVAVFIRWDDPNRAERVAVVDHRPHHASSLFGVIGFLVSILRCTFMLA